MKNYKYYKTALAAASALVLWALAGMKAAKRPTDKNVTVCATLRTAAREKLRALNEEL